MGGCPVVVVQEEERGGRLTKDKLYLISVPPGLARRRCNFVPVCGYVKRRTKKASLSFPLSFRPDSLLEDGACDVVILPGDGVAANSCPPTGSRDAPGAAAAGGASAAQNTGASSSGKSSRRSSSLVSPLAAIGAVKRQVGTY